MTARVSSKKAPAASVDASVPAALQRYESGVLLDTLLPYPGNPKSHDIPGIMQSMKSNGVQDVLRVQRSTRFILGGHGTAEAMQGLGLTIAEVLWIDCDDKTARRLVLAYNRTPELGGFNVQALADFLQQQVSAEDLLGTGYSNDEAALLISDQTTPDFQPGHAGEQGKLDQKTPITCPHCHKEFTK